MIYDWRREHNDTIWQGKAKQVVSSITRGAWQFFGRWVYQGQAYNEYTEPVIVSTIDSHHNRIWDYSGRRARFGGYTKR
jgi:hypothetical protein